MLAWSLVVILALTCVWLIGPWQRSALQYQRVLWQGQVVAGLQVRTPRGFTDKLVGLRNHSTLAKSDALLLKARAVHTLGMGFAIDLVFLARDGKVLAIKPACASGLRIVRGPRRSVFVVELQAGMAHHYGFVEGGYLEFYEV